MDESLPSSKVLDFLESKEFSKSLDAFIFLINGVQINFGTAPGQTQTHNIFKKRIWLIPDISAPDQCCRWIEIFGLSVLSENRRVRFSDSVNRKKPKFNRKTGSKADNRNFRSETEIFCFQFIYLTKPKVNRKPSTLPGTSRKGPREFRFSVTLVISQIFKSIKYSVNSETGFNFDDPKPDAPG